MTLLIMAAGLGSRYGGLKQLDGVGPKGELIIEYSIYDAVKAGFDRVVFLIKEEHEAEFEEKITQKIRGKVDACYAYQNNNNVPPQYKAVFQRSKPLGTGHAILCCKDAIDGDDFAVINADDFYSYEAFAQIAQFLKANKGHCLAGYELANTISQHGTVARGVCTVDEHGFLVDIVEHEKIDAQLKNNAQPFVTLNPDTMVSMNAWGFKPSMFSLFEEEFYRFLSQNEENLATCEFYVAYPIKKLLERESITALQTTAKWFGMTYQEDKKLVVDEVATLIAQGVYPERLWSV